MEDRNVKRGDIYHADLDPVFGSEQGGYRPVLVIMRFIRFRAGMVLIR